MSSIPWFGLAVMLVLSVSACDKASTPPAAPATDVSPVTATTAVRAGMKNQLFAARTSREIRATDGTAFVLGPKGPGDRVTTLIAQRANDGITVNCGCSAGCSEGSGEPISIGCNIVMDSNNPTEATCGGECSSPNATCMSCSFAFQTPPSSDPRADWVRDVTGGPGGTAGVDAGASEPDAADGSSSTPGTSPVTDAATSDAGAVSR
jgi:hypothetical protein